MSLDFFRIEKGLAITAENGSTDAAQFLTGSAAPGGDTGPQDDAPIGSLYLRSNGQLYTKVADTNAVSDWEEKTSANLSSLSWRSELVRAATNQNLTAGNTDPSTWADNDDGLTHAAFAIGEYVIGDIDGTPALWEVTGVSAPNITLAAAGDALAANDTFVVQNYLPDPAGQENTAIVTYDGTNAIKVADVDWNFADGIQLASGYTPGSGNITSADSVNSAIEKLDGNNDAQDSLLGTSQGATDLGTFTGVTIPDSSTVKGALQALETAYEETDANVDDLITLSGVAENSTDLGTFTGVTIPDSSTIKAALQSIETAYEETDANVDDLITLSGVAENSTDLGTFTGVTIPDSSTVKGALQSLETAYEETDANVDDLITLSGVAENSTDLGTFTGSTIPDAQTVKQALQALETAIESVAPGAESEATGVTTAVTVDEVLVDNCDMAEWEVVIVNEASPANKEFIKVSALHDGTTGADAANTDYSKHTKLKVGSGVSHSLSVDLNGTGASQTMRLRASAGSAVTVRARRTSVNDTVTP